MTRQGSYFPIPMAKSDCYTISEVSLAGEIFKMHLSRKFMVANNITKPPFPEKKNIREFCTPDQYQRTLDAIQDVVCCNDYVEFREDIDYRYGEARITGNRIICIWPFKKDRVFLGTIMNCNRGLSHGKWMHKPKNFVV